MMDHTENRGNHPNLDLLSTAELEDLLRADFSASGDEGPDLDAVLAVMEVISNREEENIPDADVDAAWESFRARISESEDSPAESIPEKAPAAPEMGAAAKLENKPQRKKLRWAVVAAAVVCLMAVPAIADNTVDHLVQWTNQQFSILSQDGLPQEHPGGVTYAEVQETIAQLTIQPVLPNWYPEGTVLEELAVNEMFGGTNVNVSFSLKDEEFSLNIEVYDLEQIGTTKYEKNEGPVETYYVNRIPHYIMGNMEKHIVAWQNGNTENSIQGDLTVEELKMMIDSIYS